MILDAKALMEGDVEPVPVVEATFNHGLDDEFVDSLNREYANKGGGPVSWMTRSFSWRYETTA